MLTSLLVYITPVQTFKGLISQKYSHCTHSTNSVRQVPYGQKLVAARALKKTVKNIHNVPSVPSDKAAKQSDIPPLNSNPVLVDVSQGLFKVRNVPALPTSNKRC